MKQLIAALQARYVTVVINEFLTSQKCPFCAGFVSVFASHRARTPTRARRARARVGGSWLKKSRPTSIRYYTCPHAADGMEHNKDVLAALAMLIIGFVLCRAACACRARGDCRPCTPVRPRDAARAPQPVGAHYGRTPAAVDAFSGLRHRQCVGGRAAGKENKKVRDDFGARLVFLFLFVCVPC